MGFEIRRARRKPSAPIQRPRRTMAESTRHIAGLGFKPGTLIDVGVATGTPALYETFKDSTLLLVEPVQEFEAFLKAFFSALLITILSIAMGVCTGNEACSLVTIRYRNLPGVHRKDVFNNIRREKDRRQSTCPGFLFEAAYRSPT